MNNIPSINVRHHGTQTGAVHVVGRVPVPLTHGWCALQLRVDFLETVPYCDNTHYEGHWQQTLYIMFALLTGYHILVEQRTAKGRIDITLETKIAIDVMELKFNKTAE